MSLKQTLPALLALTGGLLLAASWWLIFMYAPTEAIMGAIQKIFYIHLPLSWWALLSFFLVFLCSVAYLVRPGERLDRVARACAEIGVLLTTLTLVTGMLWGRRAWGVWWTWDPRLTTALIMWFIYTAYLLLGGLNLSEQRRRMVRAVVGIVAFADVPLVFLSARLWRSIHPAVFANESGGLEPEMKLVALFSVLAMGFFWLGLVLVRCQQLKSQDRIEDLLSTEQNREEQTEQL